MIISAQMYCNKNEIFPVTKIKLQNQHHIHISKDHSFFVLPRINKDAMEDMKQQLKG